LGYPNRTREFNRFLDAKNAGLFADHLTVEAESLK
jgi:hypothetical protein